MYLDNGQMYGGAVSDVCKAIGRLSKPEKHQQDYMSTVSMVVIGSTLDDCTFLFLFSSNVTPPYIHPMPRYVTAHDEFHWASPTLALQVSW